METITVVGESKEEKYEGLFPQMASLLADEYDDVANMANVGAALAATFPHFLWVGFYLLKGDELVLGPFQGKVACTRIGLGKGVCGRAAAERKTLVVRDVSEFPGHIVCDPASRAEIVVPMFDGSKLLGVLDVDSDKIGAFDEIDKEHLEQIVNRLVAPKLLRRGIHI